MNPAKKKIGKKRQIETPVHIEENVGEKKRKLANTVENKKKSITKNRTETADTSQNDREKNNWKEQYLKNRSQ